MSYRSRSCVRLRVFAGKGAFGESDVATLDMSVVIAAALRLVNGVADLLWSVCVLSCDVSHLCLVTLVGVSGRDPNVPSSLRSLPRCFARVWCVPSGLWACAGQRQP